MREPALLGLGVLVGSVVCACTPARPHAEASSPVDPPPPCVRSTRGELPLPLGRRTASGAIALAHLGAHRIAYVADEDSRALHTVDLDAGRTVATTRLPGSPSAVLVLDDGRVATTLRDVNRVAILEPRLSGGGAAIGAPLALLCTADVPTEPVALAAAPGEKLLVSSAWARRVTALDLERLAPVFSVATPREPRAIVVDASGRRAFVAHVVGARMSMIELDGGHELYAVPLATSFGHDPRRATPTRTGCQGFALASWTIGGAERMFAPMVSVDPGGPGASVPTYYGPPPPEDRLRALPKEAPMVAVVGVREAAPLATALTGLGARTGGACLLPRVATVRGSTQSLYVACMGIDALLELDARGLDPARLERRRVAVPSGPTGLAIDDERGEAFVWSQFDPTLTVVPLDGAAPPRAIRAPYEPHGISEDIARGRVIFHRSDDLRIATDGVACASCHPDGRDDAVTWTTPSGPRQTIALAGRTEGTAPYGWPGLHRTIGGYVANTIMRLGGFGLSESDLGAVAAYVRSVRPPAATNQELSPLAARGKVLFDSDEQGCSGCHIGGTGTDHAAHDVSSSTTNDQVNQFDTPSLRFVGGSAPYFHDGRYETLDALLAAKTHRMGHAAALDPESREALVAYLETL